MLEHLPGNLHVVVSTRIDPPWPLARYRARNRLVEIRAQDLRFTNEEAASFLNRMMGLNLTTENVAALEERTEGWVAGLQLAALSMKGRSDVAGFIKAFTGSHIYIAEYLVEEVLQRQPDEVQSILAANVYPGTHKSCSVRGGHRLRERAIHADGSPTCQPVHNIHG